jgi:hypothetical protein
MQKNNVNVMKFLAAMLFMLLTVNVSAQTTMKEVADAFNLGV